MEPAGIGNRSQVHGLDVELYRNTWELGVCYLHITVNCTIHKFSYHRNGHGSRKFMEDGVPLNFLLRVQDLTSIFMSRQAGAWLKYETNHMIESRKMCIQHSCEVRNIKFYSVDSGSDEDLFRNAEANLYQGRRRITIDSSLDTWVRYAKE